MTTVEQSRPRQLLAAGAALAALGFSTPSFGAATIAILNANAPNVGFNDPTPAAPVGGNPGTTLGQQRLNAFQFAANLWGATITSNVTIIIQAGFSALTCNDATAVLGSAGSITASRDFAGAPLPNTLFGAALANKLAGTDLSTTTNDISANFNINLGQPGCLTGTPFYLGLDNNHGTQIDLVAVLLHEFGHGLGFQTFTSGLTGVQFAGSPSIYDYFLLDTTLGLTWNQMTNAQRVQSAINTRRLVWTGANVSGNVPTVLAAGTPGMKVLAPANLVGSYSIGGATFGPPLTVTGLTGEVMNVIDQANGTGLACTPFNAANALAVNGKIALVDRGVCGFTVKAANAQAAGAVAVILANNVTSSPPPGLGGVDPTIAIPTVSITLADATALKSILVKRSRTKSGLFVTLGVDTSVRAGTDPAGRVLMYTPNPFESGSSVSHWDTIASPNQLMEPSINGDLTHSVIPPQDLTFQLLRDIGW